MDRAFSSNDVRDLALNPGESTKIRIIDKLSSNFNKERLNPEERLIAEDILRFLAADLSLAIREAIANKFCSSKFLPTDVALKLAFDLEDSVAMPVISKSCVFHDNDFMDIIEKSPEHRQKAVAARTDLTPNVTSFIAHETSAAVTETLVKNKHCKINEAIAAVILNRHGDNENLLRAMIQHKRIDLSHAHDLLIKVSENLRNYIIVEYNIPSTTVNNLVHDSKEWALLNMLKAHANDIPTSPSLQQIVTKMKSDGELGFAVLVKSLSVGNIAFFEAAMVKLANTSIENLDKLLWQAKDGYGYARIHELCKFPEPMRDSMWELLKTVHEEKQNGSAENITQRIHHRLLKVAQSQQVRNLDYMLTIVAHNIRKLKR